MDNLRISTITAISKISNIIKLSDLYEKLNINDEIKYIEFNSLSKGINNKKKKRNNNKIKKVFYNQLTIHIFLNKIINIKIFNNGTVQMTGLKYKESGYEIMKILINQFKNIDNIKLFDISNIKLNIVLINSDFDIGYTIDREKLHLNMLEKPPQQPR